MSKARDLANAGTALTTVSATELGYLDGVTSAVQTQIDSKIGSASAINPTIVDAKGDIVAATAADTVARLAVGSNDTVLTADSSTATGLKWAAAGGALSVAQIATGSLPTGTNVLTLTGLTQDYLVLRISQMNQSTIGGNFTMRLNNDSTGGNYTFTSMWSNAAGSNAGSANSTNSTSITLLTNIDTSASANSTIVLSNNKTAGFKTFEINSNGRDSGGQLREQPTSGMYLASAALTRIDITASGNFTSGTYTLWGA
jgi:hypothetical protein